MRDLWTDERLDDLNRRVDSGFSETSREFQAVRLELGRSAVRFLGGLMMATNAIGFIGIIVLVITEL